MEAGRVGEGKKNLSKKGKQRSAWRLPLVGDEDLRTGRERKVLTKPAFSWKPRPQGAVSGIVFKQTLAQGLLRMETRYSRYVSATKYTVSRGGGNETCIPDLALHD